MSNQEQRRRKNFEIERGIAIRDQHFHNQQILYEAEKAKKIWSDYHSELLTRLFNNSSVADEYDDYGKAFGFGGAYTFHDEVEDFRVSIGKKITKLESILERLDLIPDIKPQKSIPVIPPRRRSKRDSCKGINGLT